MRPGASAMPCPQPDLPGLPPTLCPNPIRSAAPAPDRRAGILGAASVYLGMALSGIGLSHLLPRAATPRPTRTEPWDIRDFLEKTPAVREPSKSAGRPGGTPTRPEDWVKPPEHLQVPEETPDRLPDGRDRAAGLYHEGMPPGDGAPAPGGDGPGDPDASRDGRPPTILELGSQAPAILSKVDPVYPTMARIAHLEGTVELSILVDEGGRPVEIRVLGGPVAFLAECERAVRQWRFTPASANGVPAPARFRLTLHFRLRA